jgi:hypothetical protein
MKTIVATIVALGVLAGIAAPLSAEEFNPKTFDVLAAAGTQPLLIATQLHYNPPNLRRTAMKTIVSALVALSVLAGIAAAPASADDAKTFFDNQSRQAD